LPMPGKILLLIDTLRVRAEPLTYALELAARTDSSVAVLIILSLEEAAKATSISELLAHAESTINEALRPHLDAARKARVSLDAVLRLGVPSSELMKFLAESSTVITIVWGGEPSLTAGTARSRRSHWLAQIRETLECPVVVPLARSRCDEPAGREVKGE
jgi:hypothetical protein